MAIDLVKQMAERNKEKIKPGELYNTPNLDELENGPWPSFVTGMKRLASDTHEGASMVRDVLGTLETSYVTKKGYWKGGTVGVIGYGGGVIPRFNELKDENGDYKFKDAVPITVVNATAIITFFMLFSSYYILQDSQSSSLSVSSPAISFVLK